MSINKQQREPKISLALYYLFKWSVVNPLLRGYFRGRIYGAEYMPKAGPVLVVANHASDFDPPIVSSCVRRPVSYMAKQELFQVPVLSSAIRLYGAYPVQRGGAARGAIRAALKQLDQGWAVGVFLQGTRTPRWPDARTEIRGGDDCRQSPSTFGTCESLGDSSNFASGGDVSKAFASDCARWTAYCSSQL